MTLKEAYIYYYTLTKDSENWTKDFIQENLKRNGLDYQEYSVEEFKDKLLTDDKFNKRWSNGCTEYIDSETHREMRPELKEIHEQKTKHVKAQEYDKAKVLRDKENEIISTLPKRIIVKEETWDDIFKYIEDTLHEELPQRVKNFLKNKYKTPNKL